MNSLVGKSTGIALLMAAALLAALFSMGVFSATGVFATSTAPVFEDTVDDIDVDGTDMDGYRHYVSLGAIGSPAAVEVGTIEASIDGTLLEAEEGDTISEAVVYSITGEDVVDAPTFPNAAVTEAPFSIDHITGVLTYTGADPGFVATAQIKVWAHRALKTTPLTGDPSYAESLEDGADTVGSAILEIIPKSYATSSEEPGSNQRLEIQARLEVDIGDSIVVKLGGFGVPSSIDEDDVEISNGRTGADSDVAATGNPSAVDISGTTVTLFFQDLNGAATAGGTALVEADVARIVFQKRAGITLPTGSDTHDILLSSTDTEEDDASSNILNSVNTVRTVKVDKSSGARGTEIAITGKGFSNGTASLRVNGTAFRTPEVTDNAFSLSVSTDVKDGDGDPVFQGGDNELSVNDASNTDSVKNATHKVSASFSYSPDSIFPGESLTITVNDTATAGAKPTSITFVGADPVTGDDIGDAGDEKNTTWKVTVPELDRLGNLQLQVVVDGETLKKTVPIAAKDLNLSPSTAVAGQEITIQGSGFQDEPTDVTSLKIGPASIPNSSNITVDSGGSMTVTVVIPESVKAGERTVEFRDKGGRIGKATLTVPEPSLTVEPAESLIGSEATVSGSGFPANDLIQITYADGPGASADDRPVGNATTDPTGNFSTTFKVPSFAETGETHKVSATSQLAREDANQVSEDAEHSTPDPAISFNPEQVESGSNVAISGANFAGFRAVEEIKIGNAAVLPVPAPTTGANGSFSAATILVPQLDPGSYTVRVVVGDDTVTAFLQVVAAVAPSAPADVFADLIEAGVLDRVFRYNNTDQSWNLYDPDPGFEDFNDLTELSSGEDIVWVELKEAATFQGENLLAGWSLITID